MEIIKNQEFLGHRKSKGFSSEFKEKGSYFEVSDKKYPTIELPRWMLQIEESEE